VLRNEVCTNIGMPTHHRPLISRQRSSLVENLIPDAELSEIVQ
jgi:hypothetical protein